MKDSNNNNKSKKKGLFKIVLLMVIGIIFIAGGIYITMMTTPKSIIRTSFSNAYSNLKNIIFLEKEKTDLGSTFTINSNINVKASDSRLNSDSFFKNINNTSTNLVFSQDYDNKQLLSIINSKKDNSDLVNYKYLVDNSTGYYYLKEFTDNYINVGSNNYFENISDGSFKNYNYLINKLIEFIPKNMKKENVSQEKENTSLDDEEVNLLKTTYLIDNRELIDLINNVKKDLKKDSKSNSIINNIDKDYLNNKISTKARLLDKNTFIKYSIYTDMFYRAKKIELEIEENNQSKIISYEMLEDTSLVKIIDKGIVQKKYYITNTNNKYNIKIKDGKSKDIGKIEFENTETKQSISYETMDTDYKVDFSFNRNLDNIVPNKSYKSKGTLNLSITDLKSAEKVLVLTADITGDFSNKVQIEENTSKALLKSSFTEDENNKLDETISNIKNKIFGSDLNEKA